MNELDVIRYFNDASNHSMKQRDNNESIFKNVFVVGCPRSGTTALMQLMSQTELFAYPTNIMTRFCSSMQLSVAIQELVFNTDFGLVNNKGEICFQSDYGRSSGPLNVNEFFHFFRRFFPNHDIEYLSRIDLEKIDIKNLISELNIIKNFYKKPFVSKGLMMQYNLDYFYNNIPNSIFVYIERDPLFVMQSIYKARIKEMGDVETWWSAKPKEYSDLVNRNIYEQIAGQVYFTNKAITSKLSTLPKKDWLSVRYEDFVSSPEKTLMLIANKSDVDITTYTMTNMKEKIHQGNKYTLPKTELDQLMNAYENIADK